MKKPQGTESRDGAEADAVAGEPFESMFRQARGDGFTPNEKERLWQAVSAGILGGRGAGGAPSAGGKASSGGLAGAGGKLAVVLLAASAIVATLVVGRGPGSRPIPSANAPAPPGASGPLWSPPSASPGQAPPVVTWDDLPRVREAASTAVPAGPARSTRPRSEPSPPSSRDPNTAPPGVDAPTAATAAAPASPLAGAPAESPAVDPTEGSLLLRARQLVNSSPGVAFALTQEAAQRFPDGPLAQERDALAISALVAQGRSAEARVRLEAFQARHPRSPLLPRLEKAVAP